VLAIRAETPEGVKAFRAISLASPETRKALSFSASLGHHRFWRPSATMLSMLDNHLAAPLKFGYLRAERRKHKKLYVLSEYDVASINRVAHHIGTTIKFDISLTQAFHQTSIQRSLARIGCWEIVAIN
jgi:hypothetical protein